MHQLDCGALVRAVVVQDKMDVEFRGHFPFQLVEKPDEFLAAIARQATADHTAIQDVEAGKQRGSPVPFVIMRWRSGNPGGSGRMGAVRSNA